jgi:outer membrane protein OmpA-like peptidoglycan-associated protein
VSPSEFYDDVFTDFDDLPRTPPVAVVSDLPDRTRPRKRRRLSPAWIAAILMLLAAGTLAYLSLRDSNERATTTVPTTVSTTVIRSTTVASTVAPTTVPPATTAAPTTTLPPLATDIVYFAAGSTSINTQAAAVIDAAAAKIKANPGLTVRLTGVADSSGSASTNQLVSQRRAESVQAALTQRGAQAKYEITAAGTDATSTPDKARRVEIAYVRP